MRATDLARLSEPYPEDVEPSIGAATEALGMEMPQCRVLETEILADLTDQPPYSIGWWAPGPGTARRILIADQLYCCVASVAGNMTEAALHWLEFLDASERESARFADAVQIENGRLTISAPRPRSPLDQLSGELVRIHYAGIIECIKKSGSYAVFFLNCGYHRRNTSTSSSFKTLVRVCNKRWAPRKVHPICCFFTNLRLTTWLMVDSTNAVLIVSPCRLRSPKFGMNSRLLRM
jgi:hypothetical protein